MCEDEQDLFSVSLLTVNWSVVMVSIVVVGVCGFVFFFFFGALDELLNFSVIYSCEKQRL